MIALDGIGRLRLAALGAALLAVPAPAGATYSIAATDSDTGQIEPDAGTGGGDTDAGPSGGPSEPEGSGCGCNSGGATGWPLAVLAVALAARRRR